MNEKIYLLHYNLRNEGLTFTQKTMLVYASDLQDVKKSKALKISKISLVRNCKNCSENKGLEIMNNNARCKSCENDYIEKLKYYEGVKMFSGID